MNQRISRRLLRIVQSSMPDLTEPQQRRAYRGMKRRWTRLPSNERFAAITELESTLSTAALDSSTQGLTETAK